MCILTILSIIMLCIIATIIVVAMYTCRPPLLRVVNKRVPLPIIVKN